MAYAVENWVPYLVYFAPVAVIVGYYSWTRKSRQRSHLETQAEASHLVRLGGLRGFSCRYDARAEGGMLVRMGEA